MFGVGSICDRGPGFRDLARDLWPRALIGRANRRTIVAMRPPGSGKLFHAIVIAGAGLVGGCSRPLSNNRDASLDRPAEAGSDAGTGSDSISNSNDRSIDDAAKNDVGPGHTCYCPADGSLNCCACSCDSRALIDGGICFPCYV